MKKHTRYTVTTDQIVEEKFIARRELMYELLDELVSRQITTIENMKLSLLVRIKASLLTSAKNSGHFVMERPELSGKAS